MAHRSSLEAPEVASTLEALHRAARGDIRRFVRFVPGMLKVMVRGHHPIEGVDEDRLSDCYLAVPPKEGRFLYLTARAIAASRVVEFGTSFGVSTIYLAAAVKDNGGGLVIGTELEAQKHERAVDNVARAGLSEYVDIRHGDALETLGDTPSPVDLVFLDGWKQLYLPVLELLTPLLRMGSVVLADNINTFKRDLRPYVEHVQSPGSGFVSATMPISDGVEYSVRVD